MRYQVPQFIEVEDKIIGPLTFKQFLYLITGGGVIFLWYRFLPPLIGFPLMAVSAVFFLALAFYRVNNRPFIKTVEAAFYYTIGRRLYVWKKQPKAIVKEEKSPGAVSGGLYIPTISKSRLKDISWNIEVANKDKTVETGHDDQLLDRKRRLEGRQQLPQ
jgi:hypothetical protein